MGVCVRAPMSEIRPRELQKLFEEVIYDPWDKTGERFYEKEMLEALKTIQPDILIAELDRITEAVVSNYKGLKIIGNYRVNPANVDIEACSIHEIPVLCTSVRNAMTVAEMLMGILIVYMHRLPPAAIWIRGGQWIEGITPYYIWIGNELYGKHAGFIGFGAVGKVAAHLLDAFGYSISYYDPYVSGTPYTEYELQELLAVYGVTSTHLPVFPAIEKLISRDLLYTMKSDAVFVNTAGSVVASMEALQDMAREKRAKETLLDVLGSESSLPDDLKIIENDNVLLTPHARGTTYEVAGHQSNIIVERLKARKKQEQLKRIVYNYHSPKTSL